MSHALAPLKPYAPDLSIQITDNLALLDRSLMETVKAIPDAEKVYGRMFMVDIPATARQGSGRVKLASYDEPQFEWAKESLISGNIEDVQNGNSVLIDYGYSKKSGWKPGDIITLDIAGQQRQVQVAGILSDVPFNYESDEWVLVASEPTFTAAILTTFIAVISPTGKIERTSIVDVVNAG